MSVVAGHVRPAPIPRAPTSTLAGAAERPGIESAVPRAHRVASVLSRSCGRLTAAQRKLSCSGVIGVAVGQASCGGSRSPRNPDRLTSRCTCAYEVFDVAFGEGCDRFGGVYAERRWNDGAVRYVESWVAVDVSVRVDDPVRGADGR
jgi:hypothetical protein